MTRRKTDASRLTVTQLEAREVPAVAFAQLSGGVVTVLCDNNPTIAVVNQLPGYVTIRDVGTHSGWVFNADQVFRVDMYGGSGNDTFTSRGSTGKVIRLYGGGGNDTITGGAGREAIFGGAGNDYLSGGGGDDTVNGGAGNDYLLGGDGNDVLNGGLGDDTVNGGAGIDTMTGGNGNDTIIAIDGATGDIVQSDPGTDYIWVDLISGINDTIIGGTTGDFIRKVDAFANGADTTLNGDQIPNPNPLAPDRQQYEPFNSRPLYSTTGPLASDVKMAVTPITPTPTTDGPIDTPVLNDAGLLAAVGQIAQQQPNIIRSNIVDFGDGTYGVALGGKFYRVDNQLPVDVYGSQAPAYAQLGAQNSLWVAIFEKAYADYLTTGTAGSYQSLESVTPSAVYTALGASQSAATLKSTYADAGDFATALKLAFDNNRVPTVLIDPAYDPTATGASNLLIPGQTYMVTGYGTSPTTGLVTTVTLRNPWGTDGTLAKDNKPSDGLVTVSISNLYDATSTLYTGQF